MAFALLAAEFWAAAAGQAAQASTLQTAAGSFLFVTCIVCLLLIY